MLHHDARSRLQAVWLAASAGFLDAIGFLGSGGFFVSFMSGNSTRLGVGLSEDLFAALYALTLIASFLAGVVVFALAKRRIGPAGSRFAVLSGVASVLALAAAGAMLLPAAAIFPALAFAMGALNLTFEEDGDIRIGLTYMTGTLVKLGNALAEALSGGERRRWVPFATLWLGLALGAGAGAFCFAAIGLHGLWLAAAFVGIAAIFARPQRPAR